MAIPLVGSPAPAPLQPGKSLISGESTTFATTVGNWVGFGSNVTVSRESSSNTGYPAGTAGPNLKIATTQGNGADGAGTPNNGAQITLTAPPSGFKAGRLYVFQAYVTAESYGGTNGFIQARVVPSSGGVSPLIVGGLTAYGVAPYKWVLLTIPWMCTTDVASVIVKIGRTDSFGAANAFHVAGHGQYGPRMFLAESGWPTRISGLGGGLPTLVTGNVRIMNNVWDGAEGAYSPYLLIKENYVDIGGESSAAGDQGFVSAESMGYVGLYAPHQSVGDLADTGLNIDVGADWVGLYVSELDSDTVQLAADWTGGYMLQLRHRNSKGWSASDDGVVNARIDDFFQHTLTVAGGLSVNTDLAAHFQMPQKALIDEVRVHVGTAPTGQALIVDVNDDGTTIFTTQGNRPTIADGTNDATSGAADGGTAVAKDSVITVDVDQVGSGTAGSDLTVFIRGRYIW
jgi:hypothetical protein